MGLLFPGARIQTFRQTDCEHEYLLVFSCWRPRATVAGHSSSETQQLDVNNKGAKTRRKSWKTASSREDLDPPAK
jgi:hypothetical protein